MATKTGTLGARRSATTGERLVRFRTKVLGWTQKRMAQYMGVSCPAVHYWEKGRAFPSTAHWVRLCHLAQAMRSLKCAAKAQR